MNYVRLNVSEEAREKLKKQSAVHGYKLYEYVDQIADYFESKPYDPAQGDESFKSDIMKLWEQLRKERNSTVSFIRTQEKNILVPMRDSLEELIALMINYIRGKGIEQGGEGLNAVEEKTVKPIEGTSLIQDEELARKLKESLAKYQKNKLVLDNILTIINRFITQDVKPEKGMYGSLISSYSIKTKKLDDFKNEIKKATENVR